MFIEPTFNIYSIAGMFLPDTDRRGMSGWPVPVVRVSMSGPWPSPGQTWPGPGTIVGAGTCPPGQTRA